MNLVIPNPTELALLAVLGVGLVGALALTRAAWRAGRVEADLSDDDVQAEYNDTVGRFGYERPVAVREE